MKRVRRFYWRVRIAWLALCWVPRFNLGDRVLCGGREWVLSQGRNAPTWTLRNPDRRVESFEAHEEEFTKVRSVSNYVGSFRSGWRFYMAYWFAIWVAGWKIPPALQPGRSSRRERRPRARVIEG